MLEKLINNIDLLRESAIKLAGIKEQETLDDLYDEIRIYVSHINKLARKITKNELHRKLSDEDRAWRAENMRKNRFVKEKCTTQQQEVN